MKNTIAFCALSVIFVIFFASLVSAFQDFDSFVSSESVDVLQCSSQKSSFTVSNLGDEPIDISVSFAGSPAQWISIANDLFNLGVGEQKEVEYIVDVPCDARLGSNKIKIVIDAFDLGLQNVVPVVFNVQKPQNVDIIPNVFSQSISPCSAAFFNLTIQNTGDFEESYSFSISPFSEAQILPSDVVLSSGQKQDVLIGFIPDDCSFFGEVPISFTAIAKKTGVSASIDLSLLIDSADVLTISGGVNRIITNHSVSTARLFATNEGSNFAQYNLSIDGPSWVKLDFTTLKVNGSSSQGFNLILSPDVSVKAGEYPVVISAASKISSRIYSKDIMIKVTGDGVFSKLFSKIKSFVLSFNLKYALYGVLGIVFLIVLFFVARFLFNKKSKSQFKDDSAQDSDKETRTEDLSKQSVQESKESVKDSDTESKLRKSVERSVEKELREKFAFVPKSSVVSPLGSSKLFARLFILIIAALVLFAGYFFKDLLAIYLDYIVAGVLALIVLFGAKKIFSKFSVSKYWGFLVVKDSCELSTGWRKGLLKVSFVVSDYVEHLKVSLKSGSGVDLPPEGNLYHACRIISNCPADLFTKVSVLFKIKQSWISKNAASQKDLRLVMFVNNRWKKLDFEVTGADSKFVYVEAKSDSIGAFALVCKPKPQVIEETPQFVVQKVKEPQKEFVEEKIVQKKSEKQKRSSKSDSKTAHKVVGYIAVFVLLALVISAFAYLTRFDPLPADSVSIKGIAPQIWEQDTNHLLNVSKYFKDPDNDTLVFSATQIDNIKIEFSNGVATLTPDSGWFGTRSTVFTADDTMNGSVSSNEVSLVVKKSFVPASLKPYLAQIFGSALFVVVVIILLVFRDKIIKFLDEEEE